MLYFVVRQLPISFVSVNEKLHNERLETEDNIRILKLKKINLELNFSTTFSQVYNDDATSLNVLIN